MNNSAGQRTTATLPTAFDLAQVRYRRPPQQSPDDDDHRYREEWVDFGYRDGGDSVCGCPNHDDDDDNRDIRTDRRLHRVARLHPAAAGTAGSTGAGGGGDYYYYSGPVYGLQGRPGVLLAPQALSRPLQEVLAYKAVTEYCESPPHRTNIDLVPPRESEVVIDHGSGINSVMWELWKRENGFDKPDNEPHATSDGRPQPPQLLLLSLLSRRLPTNQRYYRSFRKLSWATMGYHYDWTTRCYDESNQSPMPTEMQTLGAMFARLSLRVEAQHEELMRHKASPSSFITTAPPRSPALGAHDYSYTASACIVNYYHTKSVMGGHRDDLELALNKPIVSISLGMPALFLLGGPTKEDDLIYPIVLRPGDVLIMGGASRLNYHSMVRLLPDHPLLRKRPRSPPGERGTITSTTTTPITTTSSLGSAPPGDTTNGTAADGRARAITDHQVTPAQVGLENEMAQMGESHRIAVTSFLSTHRININIRQVYP